MSKCRFYDDGHGNGEYCSGMNAGPPSCSLKGNEKCNGDVKKCNIDMRRRSKIIDIINKIKQEL